MTTTNALNTFRPMYNFCLDNKQSATTSHRVMKGDGVFALQPAIPADCFDMNATR